MASITPHGDGKFRVQIYKNGVRKSAVFDHKRQAQEWAVRTEAELSLRPNARSGSAKTFGQAAKLYVQTVSVAKKDGAAEWEGRRFDAMAEFFGEDTPLAKITSARIGQWRDHRLQTVADSTVLREYNLLRNLLTIARTEWKWIKESPTEGVRMPKEDEHEREEWVWGWRDIRRVLRHCQAGGEKTQQMGRAFHIALRTAMRLKEVLSAKLVGQIVVIEDSKTTKKGKQIKIPTTSQGRKVMTRYAKHKFTVTPNEGSVLFHVACVECGIRVPKEDGLTFHDSRATALTHLSRKMPVQRLQRISRHRDINILIRRYYRETAEQISAEL